MRYLALKWWHTIRSPRGLWFIARIALVGVGLILWVATVGAVALPVRLEEGDALVAMPAELPGPLVPATGSEGGSEMPRRLAGVMRQGLFKPAAPQRDKPMADQTIERIRASLRLQCIIEMAGQSVAYVHVKDLGLRKCRVGDSVSDLFTVLSVGERSVEVSILGHRTILEL